MEVGVVDGGGDAGLEVGAVNEVMSEDEATSGARPIDLVKEEVAETVEDGFTIINFVSLRLVSLGADNHISTEID